MKWTQAETIAFESDRKTVTHYVEILMHGIFDTLGRLELIRK
jgi:hypothetical protein